MSIGCVRPTQRTAAPLRLGDTPAGNACERNHWLELAPAHTKSAEAELIDWRPVWREAQGLALFDRDDHAHDLRKLVPLMGEPSLREPLRAHVEPVRARVREQLYWALGSLAATGSAVAFAATGGDKLDAGHIAGMSAGLVLGLAAAIVGLVRAPSKSARMEADLRRCMFVDGEYVPAAVERGTLRLREKIRQQCR